MGGPAEAGQGGPIVKVLNQAGQVTVPRADALACADAEGAWREWHAPRHHPMARAERAYPTSDRSCAAQKPLDLHDLGCARRPSWAGRRDLRRRRWQRTRPTLEFRPRSGSSVHDPAQRQQIKSKTAAASQRGGVSVHPVSQLPHEVEACAHLVRDQERKPHSSPSELIGRDQCASRFGAQSPMRSDSILGHWPKSWRCVRANAPPNRRRRRGGEQVRQPQSQFSRSAPAGDATTAASLTPDA